MTKRPWMPFYVGDYLADTAALSPAEHGAYLLLIFHCWQRGSFPDNARVMANITGASLKQFRHIWPKIAGYFIAQKESENSIRWVHPRVTKEIDKADDISQKRSKAAMQKHSKSSANAHANAEQLHTQSQSQSNSVPKGTAADAANLPSDLFVTETESDPEKELFTRGKEVLGKASGGLIKKLLLAKNNDPAAALVAIESASKKQNPREYVGAAIRGQEELDPFEPTQRWAM